MCIIDSSCHVRLRLMLTTWLLYGLLFNQLDCVASGSLDTTLQATSSFGSRPIDKHEEDPVTTFWLMYPSDGAVEMLPVEFKYEVGVKSMEGYLSYSADKQLCVELSGDWKNCSPMTKPSVGFDDLPMGNYTSRGYITDDVGVYRYHETTATIVSIVNPEAFEAYTAAQVKQHRRALEFPEEVSLLEWAERRRGEMEDESRALLSDRFVQPAGNDSDAFLVIGVKTAILDNFSRRQAIRDTWASKSDLPRDVKVYFVGCAPTFDNMSNGEREQLQKAINLEKRMYGDLLTDELRCEDSYPGLTNKVKDFLRFATQTFTQTPFVMIADDDIYLRADHLADRLRNAGRFRRFYMGQVWDNILGRSQVPVRDKRNRYYLPKEIYSLSKLPPFAFGPHYVMSMDCARFIAKNERQLRGLSGMDDISIALWLLMIQVHVEHTTEFSSLRIQACKNDLISFADLTSLGIRSIHENLAKHRDFCSGFDKMTWHSDERLLDVEVQRGFSLPLDIQAYIHNIKALGVLKVTCVISSPNKAGLSSSYHPSVETLSAFSSRVCEQAHTLMAKSVYDAAICEQVASEVREQLQHLYELAKESEEVAFPFLELWRYNLFIADPNASPAIVAYSSEASYSMVVLECIFASVFEHEKRPTLVVPEYVLRKNYHNRPDVFVFSILDANCNPLSKPGCQKMITHYIREYSSSDDEDNSERAAKMIMIAGEPTKTEELDDQVILLSTVSDMKREKHAYISVASTSFGERLNDSPMDLLSPRPDAAGESERQFCAYLYARCDRPQREYMFDILNAMEPVDAIGACAGTLRPPNDISSTSRYTKWYNDDAVRKFQRYKFVIAFENSPVPGYVTEKLVNPFLAGSIPIFWGNSTAASQLFNPESFINCGLFEKLRDCAAFVMKVHRSPELYEKMRRQPPVRNITAFNQAFSWHPSVPSNAQADAVAKLLQL